MLQQIFANKCDGIISIRLLLKFDLLAKMTLFGTFIVKFLKICSQNLLINIGENPYFSSKVSFERSSLIARKGYLVSFFFFITFFAIADYLQKFNLEEMTIAFEIGS